MKARYLKTILNNTEYIVHGDEDNIYIGSPIEYKIIQLNIRELTLKSNLNDRQQQPIGFDQQQGFRPKVRSQELAQIWDILQNLIDNRQILEIFNSVDEIQNPIQLFHFHNGNIVERTTEFFGWPNVTADGYLLNDQEFFRTREEAINYGINVCNNAIGVSTALIQQYENEINLERANVTILQQKLADLQNLNQNQNQPV